MGNLALTNPNIPSNLYWAKRWCILLEEQSQCTWISFTCSTELKSSSPLHLVMLNLQDKARCELLFCCSIETKHDFDGYQGFQTMSFLFKQWEMKYKIGLWWLLLCRYILDKCSTVCEVASGLTSREAGITGQKFSFLKTNLSISTCLCFK